MAEIRGRERVIWQDIYAIEQTAGTLTAPAFTPTTKIGIKGDGATANSGFFLLKLTDHPDIEPPNPSLLQELTTGRSELLNEEFQAVAQEPGSVQLNTQLNAYTLSLFLRGLLQAGSGETTAAPNVRQDSMPYLVSDVSRYMALYRALDTASALTDIGGAFIDPTGTVTTGPDRMSHVATGLVPRTLTMSAEEGGIVSCQAECAVAYAGVTNVMGLLDVRRYTTSRLRMIPTPEQLGIVAANNVLVFDIYHNGVAFTTVDVVNSLSTAPPTIAGEIHVEYATGLLDMLIADAQDYHQMWITHDGYKTGVGTFTFNHPFDLGPDLEAPMLWQNALVKMKPVTRNDAAAEWDTRETPAVWVTVNLPGWSLTLNNNLNARFYDEPFIAKYQLGKFGGEGNITIPWGTDKAAGTDPSVGGNSPLLYFMAGIPMRLRVMWGGNNHIDTGTIWQAGYHYVNSNADNAVAIDQTIRYTDQNVEGENELGQVTTFQLVSDLGAETALRPDADVSTAFRSSLAYTATKLDRGQGLPLTYPESA